jgi:Ca-activated chloride channel family protein
MTLTSPLWLWLLAGLPLIWLLAWYNRAARSRRRLLSATCLRSVALVLITLALTGPVLLERSREVSVVYAIDISRSVSPAFVRQTIEWIRSENARHTPAQVRYVVFANRARMVDALDDVLAVPVAADGASAAAIDQSDTDLEQALRTALSGFAPNHARRLVLLTDGNQTRGDIWRVLPRLQIEHVRLFAIPAPVAVNNDAWVEAISIPEGVRQQEPVAASVNVFSRTQTHARVELASGTRVLSARSLTLQPGENDVAFQIRIPEAGSNVITARVSADGDENPRNDALSQSLWVGPRPRVLYVESAPESAHYLADALRAQHIEVTVAKAGALIPEELARHDAVILSDVPASSIDARGAHALETFVRDQGHGLIFAAGENTYGKQGYAGTEVERLLPVRLQGKRKRRELDLVLLIDRSHSMRGRKLELAKTAALATLDLLESQHRLAVVAFDSQPHAVVPLVEVGSKRRAEDLIAGMTASGQTNIYNALVEAQRILADSTAGTKHIILLSDGLTAPPPGTAVARSNSEETQELVRRARAETLRQAGVSVPEPAPELAARPGGMAGIVAELAHAKVTMSTVAIGDNPNLELMKNLATEGGGKSYVAVHDAEIPGLFVSETRRLLGEAIIEEPFRPTVLNRADAIAGVDFAAGPELEGFVVTRPKRFAEVLLQAVKQEPLLVQTHYGLGKTVAFLSDVKNRWAAQWLSWDGYGRFWAQLVRDTMARTAAEGISWRVRRQGGEAVIEISAIDQNRLYRDNLAPKVRLTRPGGETAVLALRQIGPGRYRASAPMTTGSSEPYRFEALEGGGIAKRDLAQLGPRTLSYPWSDEYRVLPPNNALLRALSEQTGGMFAPKADDIFAWRGDGGLAPRPLWQWFAAAALVAFLLDILVRRAPRF